MAVLSASLALAEDFKTINGKEYKNAKVSRVEPDGIVLITKSGISRVYFTELPKEVQKRFGYDLDKLEAEKAAARVAEEKRIQEQKAAEQEREKTAQKAEPTSPSQLDDAQFNDLRRRDWYEDLKTQEKLKNHADYMLALMDQIEKNDSLYQRCTPMFYEMLAAERKAHRDNYRALSAIAAKIAAAKNYDDYKKLKTIEDEVLGAIETQKIKDQTDVAKLRFHVSEGEAALLEEAQRVQ